MATRVAALGRVLFVWTGLLVMATIALVASTSLGLRMARALIDLPDAQVTVGLLAVVIGSLVALLVLALAARLASRDRLGLRVAVAGGFLLLAIARLILGLAVDAGLTGEKAEFDALARGILAGDCCFGDRSPGYPLALAGAYAIFGPTPLARELLNIGLGLVAGGALFALLHAHAGDRAAVVGLYLFAMWPAGALISNAPLSETLYIALLLLAGLAALRATHSRFAVATGALLAVAQYVRPTTIALVPAFLIASLWPSSRLRKALLATVLPVAATFLILLTPVAVYNVHAHGELSLSTSAFGGWSLYMGTDERTGGRFSQQALAEIEALTPGGLWEDSAAAGDAAVARILRDPLIIARLLPDKFLTLWGSENYGALYGTSAGSLDDPIDTFPVLASGVFYAAVTIGALVVTFIRRREIDALGALCIGLVLIVTLIHVFAEVRDRYHAYVTPFLVAVVALGLASWLADRARAGEQLAAEHAA